MLKIRNFGDLEEGDIVWREDRKEWRIIPIKVIKVGEALSNHVRIYLEGGPDFLVRLDSYYYDLMYMWSDKEKMISNMKERATRLESIYINKIDELISQYDNLLRWKKGLEI